MAHHLAAYGGRDEGLFVRAIAQSPYWGPQATADEAEATLDRVMSNAGCQTMSCLRGADLRTLQEAANATVLQQGGCLDNALCAAVFRPVIDGELVPDHLSHLYDQARFLRLPLLVGSDTDEGSFFAPNASSFLELAVFLQQLYPGLNATHLQAIQELYPLMPAIPGHAAYFPTASAAVGDAALICPGIYMSQAYSDRGLATWNYRYNVQDPLFVAMGFGVPHTQELDAIFGPLYGGPPGSAITTINANIVPVVMHYYISFIQNLNPNTARAKRAPWWKPVRGGWETAQDPDQFDGDGAGFSRAAAPM